MIEVDGVSPEQPDDLQVLTNLSDVVHKERPKDLVTADYRLKEVSIIPKRTPEQREEVGQNWRYDRGLIDYLAENRVRRELNVPGPCSGFLVVDYNVGKVFAIEPGSLVFDEGTAAVVYQPKNGAVPELHPFLRSELEKYGGRPNPMRAGKPFKDERAGRWLNAYLPKKMDSIRRQLAPSPVVNVRK